MQLLNNVKEKEREETHDYDWLFVSHISGR